MNGPPPIITRTDTLCPDSPLFLSHQSPRRRQWRVSRPLPLPPRRNRRLIASRMHLLCHRRRTRSGTTKPNARWMTHRFLFFPRRLKRHPPEQRRNRTVANRASRALRHQKSIVEGKSVTVRIDSGGRRTDEKKNDKN